MTSVDKKRVDVFKLRCYLLSKTTQGIMGVDENEQTGFGKDWVCFGVDIGYGGDEDQVIWTNRPKKIARKKSDTGEDGRQTAKGQTCKYLVSGCKVLDKAGRMHPNWQTIGKDGGKSSESAAIPPPD